MNLRRLGVDVLLIEGLESDFRTSIDSGLGLDTCEAPKLQNWSEL